MRSPLIIIFNYCYFPADSSCYKLLRQLFPW